MNDVELIKSKLNIVDVIREYVPDLKKNGRNWSAKSPFRSEKTPSFIVNEELGIFKDFGGDKSGDIITFIMEMENLSFPDALKFCANKLGITLSNTNNSTKNLQDEVLKKCLLEINRFCADLFNYILKDSHMGRSAYEYCINRQIDGEVIEKYKVGYAPINLNLSSLIESKIKFPNIEWEVLGKRLNVDETSNFNKILQVSGIFTNRNGFWVPKFKDRLMFPIIGQHGEVLGFSGRIIQKSDQRPKYINSPETLVYKKSEVLFNFYQAKQEIKKKDFVIITEGQLDAIMSTKVGISNIVAPLGTSLTLENVKFLKRYTDNFYLCFDQDEAGMNATKRAYEIITSIGGEVKRIDLINVKDIDELIRISPQKYLNAVEESEDYILYLLALIVNKNFDKDILNKSKRIEELLNLVGMKKSQVIKHEYLKIISNDLSIPFEELKVLSNSFKQLPKKNFENNNVNELITSQYDKPEKIFETRKFDPKELYLLALVYNYLTLNDDFQKLPKDFFYTVDNKYVNQIENIVDDDELVLQISTQRIPEEEENAIDDYNHLKQRLISSYKKRQMKKKALEIDKNLEESNEAGLDNDLREVMGILKGN